MESRMTLCNMSIESGARAGMIAPDETTFAYVKGRPFAPEGAKWEEALRYWQTLASDRDARFDRVIQIDAGEMEPHVTWGTNPAWWCRLVAWFPIPAKQKAMRIAAQPNEHWNIWLSRRVPELRISISIESLSVLARTLDLRTCGPQPAWLRDTELAIPFTLWLCPDHRL
jgi:hypothetical protein